MYENVLIKTENGIRIISINRPDQLNALNKKTIAELSHAVSDADKDDLVGLIIITGEGEKSFVAGADIKEFADFSIPWDLDFSYSLRFSKQASYQQPGEFTTSFNQDVNFNGSVNLSPKWKVGMSGSYNITLKQLGVLTMNLSRDLHCWQMSIVLSPVGRYKYFTINISPKSSILRDLKVNRTRYFYDL